MVDLSVDECVSIVRKATSKENVKIEKFSSEHFGDFLGYLGEYYKLRITACFDGTEVRNFQFFVKSLPIIDMRNRREMLIETGIFHKELRIYENIIQKFVELDMPETEDDIWCPTIYLIRYDLVVLNDLTLQDYKVLPFDAFDFSQQHVEATLKSLANFHACSIAYEHKENVSIGKVYSDILFETSITDIPWFTVGLEVVKNIAVTEFGVSNSEIFYKKIFNVIEIMESSPFNIPKVLCHRDLYKNNLMFRDDPLKCILIDFQTSRYLSLSVDVMMAIICTTRREHYEMMMDYYLLFYFQCLAKKLLKFSIDIKELMEYEDFVNSCNYHKKVVLVYKTFLITLTQVPQELFKNFTKADYLDLASGDRCRLTRKFMEQDEPFRERVMEAVGAVVSEFSGSNQS